ncbi:MAG: hypothetical protein IPK80_23735 [Nannocystis sp.]|nr:hypothetical protein [Nannocystis sp.]
MENETFPAHSGARTALNIAAVLMILLVVTAPLGLYIIVQVNRGQLKITDKGVSALSPAGISNVSFDFAEIERLGLCRIRVVAAGIGGFLARKKVGGDEAVNLCVVLKGGRRRLFTASMFEGYERAIEAITARSGRPLEQFEAGAFGVKWPKGQLTS